MDNELKDGLDSGTVCATKSLCQPGGRRFLKPRPKPRGSGGGPAGCCATEVAGVDMGCYASCGSGVTG